MRLHCSTALLCSAAHLTAAKQLGNRSEHSLATARFLNTSRTAMVERTTDADADADAVCACINLECRINAGGTYRQAAWDRERAVFEP